MKTINGTFAAIERQLLNNGFSCAILDRNCSVFKTDKKVAYVYFLGLGRGFECSEYEIVV